ncbi:hypothetical protein BP5796_11692 [Coleophoma crateriformis]|uniref:Amidohydrolase-related domain-containing protein n=1 Tax=Coleophoma crateriformis TaxID=565419 RepID=A0A3D8QE20_9HELO|nr:hypothetical protein BP5796_11692 [Coleophoma crateriformis]
MRAAPSHPHGHIGNLLSPTTFTLTPPVGPPPPPPTGPIPAIPQGAARTKSPPPSSRTLDVPLIATPRPKSPPPFPRGSSEIPILIIAPSQEVPSPKKIVKPLCAIHEEEDPIDINALRPRRSNWATVQKPWAPGPHTPYVLYDCQLIDPRNGIVRKDVTLFLAEGKIASVAPTTEKDRTRTTRHAGVKAVKIGGKGFFVCPGLIDCHVHLMAGNNNNNRGSSTTRQELAVMRSAGVLRGMLSNGFTTVRDAGGATLAHSKATEEFLIPGPRVFQGGKMLFQTSGLGDTPESWERDEDSCSSCCGVMEGDAASVGKVVDGVPECTKAVRECVRNGANHINVCVSGGPTDDNYNSLLFNGEELRAITSTSKNMKNVPVSAHCFTSAAIHHAIECSVDSIEHGNMLLPETAQLMASKGIFLTPTLTPHTRPAMSQQSSQAQKQNSLLGNAGLRSLRTAHEAGVSICFGTGTTPATLPFQTYEFTIRSHMLPSNIVLQQATINAAKLLGMEGKLGEIVPGAFADLLFLRRNPLVDVDCLDDVGAEGGARDEQSAATAEGEKDLSSRREAGNLALVMKDGRIVLSRIDGVGVERACAWD